MKKNRWHSFVTVGILISVSCTLLWQYGVPDKTKGFVWASTLGSVIKKTDAQIDQQSQAEIKSKTVSIVHPKPIEGGRLITLPGRARASQQATLFFRVSGPLNHVLVNPGDSVKKGQLLLRLDDRDYLRQVRTVESRLRSAQANLKKMENGARTEDIRIIESSLVAARADLQLAEKELKRYEILFKNAAASEQDSDRAENSVKTLKARTDSLEQQLSRDKSGARKEDILAARAGIEELEVQLDIARDRFNDTRLVAPFDGVITSRIPEAFEMVRQGEPVITLDNIAIIEIPVDVPENQVKLFLDQEGGNAYAARFLTTGSRQFSARRSEYSSRADQNTGTYEFVFSVTPDRQDLIFPGMTAEISVYAGKTNQDEAARLVIPLKSLTGVFGNSAQVFLVDMQTKTARKTEIVFDTLSGSDNVVVIHGLSPADLVVTAGSSFIRPGQSVDFKLPNLKFSD